MSTALKMFPKREPDVPDQAVEVRFEKSKTASQAQLCKQRKHHTPVCCDERLNDKNDKIESADDTS